ncbi:LysR family transcriptional regulator [Variovorax dokdonensis]|uniref:LysR family transcriptional regulator n=1 Tax=Variovorax dokdonensis TaxID=344883 RepID=A0ABT7NAR7_9BURK|nr:LysR family transcriptional regulator [Variovorax dokdonensis]MDM0045022.1 LysR family transcriptional regulator [Variovorax dokdonensis]
MPTGTRQGTTTSFPHRLTFQHLQYLQALVEERHVTRAAERMGIGQPAMSTALARLREVFKDVLLVKTTTGMEPTPRALDLVRRVREIADMLEGRGFEAEHFEPATSQARWRIMASDGISRTLLPEMMALVMREAPHMRFTVQPGDPRRLSEYLRDGDFDLALSFVRSPPSELRQTVLYPQRLLCIARQNHPLIKGKVSLEDFVSCQHARWGAPPVAHATMEAMVDEALDALGHARPITLLVSSLTLLPDVVAGSDLLAVVPEHMARAAAQALPIQLLPLPFKVASVDVSMVWHERLHHDPAHKWMRESLRDIGKKLSKRPSM